MMIVVADSLAKSASTDYARVSPRRQFFAWRARSEAAHRLSRAAADVGPLRAAALPQRLRLDVSPG
jgi:hypothetical protein